MHYVLWDVFICAVCEPDAHSCAGWTRSPQECAVKSADCSASATHAAQTARVLLGNRHLAIQDISSLAILPRGRDQPCWWQEAQRPGNERSVFQTVPSPHSRIKSRALAILNLILPSLRPRRIPNDGGRGRLRHVPSPSKSVKFRRALVSFISANINENSRPHDTVATHAGTGGSKTRRKPALQEPREVRAPEHPLH